jgi:DnaJ-class molecular chaperone
MTTVNARDIRGVLVSVACDACGGTGESQGVGETPKRCRECNGAGNVGKTVTFQVFA